MQEHTHTPHTHSDAELRQTARWDVNTDSGVLWRVLPSACRVKNGVLHRLSNMCRHTHSKAKVTHYSDECFLKAYLQVSSSALHVCIVGRLRNSTVSSVHQWDKTRTVVSSIDNNIWPLWKSDFRRRQKRGNEKWQHQHILRNKNLFASWFNHLLVTERGGAADSLYLSI